MTDEFDKIIDTADCIEQLNDSTVTITGATGTIGSYLVRLLLHYNAASGANVKIVCPVRDPEKAAKRFGAGNIRFVKYSLNEDFSFDFDTDYVIHCAGPTRSAEMVQKPVDTIDAIYGGTRRMLDYFKAHGRKGFLYVSSVEIYGENFDENKIFAEDTMGAVDPLKVRSSYPEAKRLAETLCVSYASQYGLPVKIARLTQILGVGEGDNRLIAYLCDCAKNRQRIVLKSDGKATKAYCYIADCASALINILIKGENTAYNVANEDLALSVYGLAKFVAEKYIDGQVTVENKDSAIYPKSSYLILDAHKLRALGWTPAYGLDAAFEGLLKSY